MALSLPAELRAEHEGQVQILLLGDSTTEASIPRKLAPQEPQLEDVIRVLLAAEGDLPPTHVINLGLSGEFIRRLLDSGRYGLSCFSSRTAELTSSSPPPGSTQLQTTS